MATALPDSSIQPVSYNQVQNDAAQSCKCGYTVERYPSNSLKRFEYDISSYLFFQKQPATYTYPSISSQDTLLHVDLTLLLQSRNHLYKSDNI